MRSMRADGLDKALAGRTTLEEVLRVTPAEQRAGRREPRLPVAPEPPGGSAVLAGRQPVEVAG
jgi:hypothetical protein